MDRATQEYINAMGLEVTSLAAKVEQAEGIDDKIAHLQELAFRAGFYWNMLETIKGKTYS